jgi:ornithine carbamoyltransferase
MEVTEEALQSPAPVVFDDAEHRIHTIKAAVTAALGD